MANYMISKVRVSKPVIEGENEVVVNNARKLADEALETLRNEFSSDVEEVWNEINEEAQFWDGVSPECWIDENTEFVSEEDYFIFNVISNDLFPLAQLFETFRDRYYPLCIDAVFADEIADYEIDYSNYDYGDGVGEVSELGEVFEEVGNVGIMRLRQCFNIESSDEEEPSYDMRWRFIFPVDDEEKEKMKKTAWAGCTFSDVINSEGGFYEGEDGVMTLEDLLEEYPLDEE